MISDHIEEVREFDRQAKRTPLTSIQGFENETQAATEIIENLKTLPWLYRFRFYIPRDIANCIDVFLKNVYLSENIRFVVNDDFKEECNTCIKDATYTENLILERTKSHVIMEFTSFGFIGKQLDTITDTRAKFKVRAFFGLAVALGLFRTHRRFSNQKEEYIITCDIINGTSSKFVKSIAIEDRYNMSIFSTVINPEFSHIEEKSQKERWIQKKLFNLWAVFSNENKNERLIRAAQWLFDGYTGDDELLCFIQTVVVLEILLGEEVPLDDISLGALLKNRCAYLISETLEEREKIIRDFSDIYKVRSHIVHRGKQEFSTRERALFRTLQDICERVIREEVRLLEGDLFARMNEDPELADSLPDWLT